MQDLPELFSGEIDYTNDYMSEVIFPVDGIDNMHILVGWFKYEDIKKLSVTGYAIAIATGSVNDFIFPNDPNSTITQTYRTEFIYFDIRKFSYGAWGIVTSKYIAFIEEKHAQYMRHVPGFIERK